MADPAPVRRHKRRQLIVSGLQYRLLTGNFLYLVTVMLALFVATLIPLIATLDDEALAGGQRDAAARNLLEMTERQWVAVPIVVLLCMFHSILVSHRIAGPLYRIKKVCKELRNGDLSIRVKLRRADYLMPEAECVNEMIEGLAERAHRVHDAHVEVGATFGQLEQALGSATRSNEEAVLAGKLGIQLNHLGEAIRGFRTSASDYGQSLPERSEPHVPGPPQMSSTPQNR